MVAGADAAGASLTELLDNTPRHCPLADINFVSGEDDDATGRMIAVLEAPTDDVLSVAATAYASAGDSPAVVLAANGDRAGVDGASEWLPDDVDVVRTLGLALMGQGVLLDQAFDAVMAVPEGRRRLVGWNRECWEAAYRKAVGGTVQRPGDEGAACDEGKAVDDDERDFDAGDTGPSGVRGTASGEDGGVGNGAVCPWEINPERRVYLERNVNAVTETLLPGDRCWHDESSPRPLQGAPSELVAVADVERESEGIFCPAFESWRVGGIWYVKGVWHARSGGPEKGSV